MCLLCVFIMCLYGLIYVFNLCIVLAMGHFAFLFDISYMYAFISTLYGFFPLCVAKISDFFHIFPISLLTFCQYTFVYYMYDLYLFYVSCIY